MKKLTSIFVVCIYIFFIVPINVFSYESPYTILVYLNGSDLESKINSSAASDDLKEMLSINSKQKVNILIQTGGTLKWDIPKISNTNNQIWQIKNNELKLLKNDSKNPSMGNPNTLSEFITWSIKNFPSKKYSLILWNHGGGAVNGFGFDEIHPSDPSLTLHELNKALKNSLDNSINKFEFIGFDACLMSTIEVANTIKDYSKYMIASEELEPNHGWNYKYFFNKLNDNPEIDTIELGKIICNSYKKQSEEYLINENITLSLIDLSKIDSLIKSFENLILKIDIDINTTSNFYNILKVRNSNYDFGSSNKDKSDMIDLGELIKSLSSYYPIKSKLLIEKLNNSVIYSVSNNQLKKSTGLSIYFPYNDKDNFLKNLSLYEYNSFSIIYKSFLKKYTNLILKNPAVLDLHEIKESTNISLNNNYIETQFSIEKLEKLSSIHSFIGKTNDDKIIYYGTNNDVNINKSTGKINYTFNGKWFKLNNSFVSMYLTNDTKNYIEYTIPALLNNNEVNIKVIFNDEYPNGKISGIWEGINKVSGMSYKEISSIEFGDEIIPLFYYKDKKNNNTGYLKGDKIIVENLNLTYDYLNKGNYLYGFYILDLMQNGDYYKFNEVNINTSDNNELKIYLDNKLIPFHSKPFIKNGRTLVPVRTIFETLDFEVTWDNKNKTIYCQTKNNTEIKLILNSNIAYKNNLKVNLDTNVILKNNKTFVPLRFICESAGLKVRWEETSKSVYLTSD